MAFLEKNASAASVEDNIQRVFRARNCLNGFKNNCDNSFVQPEVHAQVAKFCANVQLLRAAEGKKPPASTPSKPAASTGTSKRSATSSAGKKVCVSSFLYCVAN